MDIWADNNHWTYAGQRTRSFVRRVGRHLIPLHQIAEVFPYEIAIQRYHEGCSCLIVSANGVGTGRLEPVEVPNIGGLRLDDEQRFGLIFRDHLECMMVWAFSHTSDYRAAINVLVEGASSRRISPDQYLKLTVPIDLISSVPDAESRSQALFSECLAMRDVDAKTVFGHALMHILKLQSFDGSSASGLGENTVGRAVYRQGLPWSALCMMGGEMRRVEQWISSGGYPVRRLAEIAHVVREAASEKSLKTANGQNDQVLRFRRYELLLDAAINVKYVEYYLQSPIVDCYLHYAAYHRLLQKNELEMVPIICPSPESQMAIVKQVLEYSSRLLSHKENWNLCMCTLIEDIEKGLSYGG